MISARFRALFCCLVLSTAVLAGCAPPDDVDSTELSSDQALTLSSATSLPASKAVITSSAAATVTAAAFVSTQPDLTLRYSAPPERDRDVIELTNIGKSCSGPFRFAVFAGSETFARDFNDLCPGQSWFITTRRLECRQWAWALADVLGRVTESDETDNKVEFNSNHCPSFEGDMAWRPCPGCN